MNRQQRRAQKKNFVAKCAMCDVEACKVHAIRRHGRDDLGICKGCPCTAVSCVWCGLTGEHWLGCAAVGLPSENPDQVLQ